MSDNKDMTLAEALSHATYAHNVQINKKCFSPVQLTFGRQGVIPGITDGNPASWEPVVESDWFREELSNRQRGKEIYRKVDSNERLQKMMAQRANGATDAVYIPGDNVLFKEKDKSKWSGPAKVTDVIGNKIRMIFAGYERTVPAIDVAHFKDEKVVVESDQVVTSKEKDTQTKDLEVVEDWKNTETLPAGWNLENNKELRPKLHDRIEFIVNGCLKDGRVIKVGKKTGKDVYRCWIKEGDRESNYDFVNEVDHWRKLDKEVSFEDATERITSTAMKEKDNIGVLHLKNWHRLEEYEQSSQGMEVKNSQHQTFASEISKNLHNNPKIVDAKEEEMS